MPNLIHWTQTILKGSKIVLFFKIFKKMKKSSLVKLSLATVVATVILSVIPSDKAKASNDDCIAGCPTHKIWDGKGCSWNDLSNCAE